MSTQDNDDKTPHEEIKVDADSRSQDESKLSTINELDGVDGIDADSIDVNKNTTIDTSTRNSVVSRERFDTKTRERTVSEMSPRIQASVITMQRANSNLNARVQENILYIQALEKLLKEHDIPLPSKELIVTLAKCNVEMSGKGYIGVMDNATADEIKALLERIEKLHRKFTVSITYRDLDIWTMMPKQTIPTVGTALKSLFLGSGPKHRVDLLQGLTGRILPGKLTLLLGPPGCGKTLFLKALCGRNKNSKLHTEGQIFYNDENIKTSKKFLIPKVSEYSEQNDTHAATLTVEETFDYAWRSTTGGHHSYAFAMNEQAAKILDSDDEHNSRVKNIIKVLGLSSCSTTYVGDATIRGISGGQKRRVTVGEMVITPRIIKCLDAISNGLDSATTYDIVRATRHLNHTLRTTVCISLLQPPPEVFDLFDEVILMSEGQIIYQGPREEILTYFESIGYTCPSTVDVADFLQVLPTTEGVKYAKKEKVKEGSTRILAPRGTTALVAAYKGSHIYKKMIEEMNYTHPILPSSPGFPSDQENTMMSRMSNDGNNIADIESSAERGTFQRDWPKDLMEPYPGSFWYHFQLTLHRQYLLTIRDATFIKARIGQNLIIGAIAGSLFSNIETTDITTLNGFLFFTVLFGALSGFSMMPIVYAQKAVYYKHSSSLFYPTSAFALAQAMVFYPLHFVEAVAFTTIMYWSAGLTTDYNGSRYLTFLLLVTAFSITISQMFRTIAFLMTSPNAAAPFAGIMIVLMVLFSGFIQPFNQISYGWKWFYWLNPISWVLKAVTVNQLKATRYDFTACGLGGCRRYGDLILSDYGNPTSEKWIWYAFALLIAEYATLFTVSVLVLKYVRSEPSPPAPIKCPDIDPESDIIEVTDTAHQAVELPFEPVTFAFKNIWYTVKGPDGEELDLLRGVNGYFEPGTVTALMGSSGAGKTTLLDVLAGRKNTGVVKGHMYVNGKLKEEKHFRRIMAYVEQFDSLSPHDTAREAIEFSAALRLPSSITPEHRQQWVNAVLDMLELQPLENTMIGTDITGGMSFEQKKRVSIGVELAANPAILFLDEPTTGLDSRAAQVVARSIRRVAASGRSIVCTIHQPSYPIFTTFDSLLLLKRGGQTVYFGELGENCSKLINFFQSAPEVRPIQPQQNPATWMLEVIGAGTSTVVSTTDYHIYYNESPLYETNMLYLEGLCGNGHDAATSQHDCIIPMMKFQTSLWHQFKWVSYKVFLSYWRTPSYNLTRMLIAVIVALIFASAYSNQKYVFYTEAISRSAVMFITCLFLGVIGLQTVMPVTFEERPAFYREQQSNMYSVAIYSFVTMIVEVPYLIVSSLCFTLPFFYIVGFDNTIHVEGKFGFYWLFQGLYMAVLVFLGQFFAAAMPSKQAADVIAGISSTFLSLFCGFMIKEQNIPTFWLFVYWLNPLHYALEGLFTTQFHNDVTKITLFGGGTGTAEAFIGSFYSRWKYEHVEADITALFLFIIGLRIATYFALSYLRHDKR